MEQAIRKRLHHTPTPSKGNRLLPPMQVMGSGDDAKADELPATPARLPNAGDMTSPVAPAANLFDSFDTPVRLTHPVVDLSQLFQAKDSPF